MSNRFLHTSARLTAGLLGVALFGSAASAQIQSGDLFIVYSATSNDSSLVQYDPTGSVVHEIAPVAFEGFTAAALTPDGNFAINKDSGFGIEIRAYDGGLINEFFTPLANGSGWDIDVFDDGAIAMCAMSVGVVLYDQAGVWLDTFHEPGMETVIGCYHAPDNTLWVVDRRQSTPDAGHVYNFDRAGVLLADFDVALDPSDIIEAGDGSLWMSDFDDGRIVQYSRDGIELSSFFATIDSPSKTLWSLAMSLSGELIALGHVDTTVRYYSQSGTVTHEYPVSAAGNSLYVFVAATGGAGTKYCFGDGTDGFCPCGNFAAPGGGCTNSTGLGATLVGSGNASATNDVLGFRAENLPAGQPALLFVGLNAPGGGDGVPFGDGLRCAGMNVTRLGVKNADMAGAASWGPGLAAQGGWAAGDTRYFQSWYRDPNGSPCGFGFNLSNGVEVLFYD